MQQSANFFRNPLIICSLIFSALWIGGDGLDFFSIGEDTGRNKRFQRVEILKIAEPCPLIDPSQVVVTQGEIMVADPVLSPIGKVDIFDGITVNACIVNSSFSLLSYL